MQVTVPVVTKPGLPANQAFKDQCFETIKSTGARTIKHLIDESINERRKPNSGRPYGVKTRKDGNGNNGGGDDNSGGNGGNGNNGNNDDDFDNNNRKKPKPRRGKRGNNNRNGSKVSSGGGSESAGNGSTNVASGIIASSLSSPTKEYTPLYILGGSLFSIKDKYKENTFNSFIEKEIYFEYITAAQINISYRVSNYISEKDFSEYFSKLTEAIQIYYTYNSIYAYTEETPYLNSGINHLRRQLNVEIYDELKLLKGNLESMYCKPILVDYIKRMYQCYSYGESAGSPIIKLVHESTFFGDPNKNALSHLANIRSAITGVRDVSQVNAIMASLETLSRIELSESSSTPVISNSFKNFWHNCCICYSNTGIEKSYSSIVKDDLTQFYYGTCTDNVTLAEYGASSLKSETDELEPGLWRPFDGFSEHWLPTNRTSLQCFTTNLRIEGVTSLQYRVSSHIYNAPYYIGNAFTVESFSYSEYQLTFNHNIQNASYSAKSLIRTLFGLE